jgi:cysteine-rich repeat protein
MIRWLSSARLRVLWLVFAPAGLVLFGADCDAFSPLYLNVDAGDDAEAGNSNWSTIQDRCPVDDMLAISSKQRTHSGTYELNRLSNDIENCGSKLVGFNGPDGVFAFKLGGGERVHFDTKFIVGPGESAPPVDLGIYVMNLCDPTSCATRVERCPAGVGESLLWNNPTAGTFYFGFDSKAYDASVAPSVTVTVTYPRCGDNVLEPGETCDDGNTLDGDGCSSECLKELKDEGLGLTEVEPNNWYIGGNIAIVDPGNTVLLRGQIGGSCDLDFFLLNVPQGGAPRVTMLQDNGTECPSDAPEFTLEFNDPTGMVKLGAAPIPAKADGGGTNYCPVFDEYTFGLPALPKNRYVIELKPFNKGVGPKQPFKYMLRIEMLGPRDGG